MRLPTALITLILSLTTVTLVHARQQPTSYCKCICFQNSTIIPLNSSPTTKSNSRSHRSPDSPDSLNSPDSVAALEFRAESSESPSKHHKLTCADCNRAFCLDYNLPICRDAKEEDVFATCFQRDSLKDETVVVLFLLVTAGLLGWALVKPFVDKARRSGAVQRYAPVGRESADLNARSEGVVPGNGHGRSRSGAGPSSISRQGGLNS